MTNMDTRTNTSWNLAQAKARLSELVARANDKGPQTLTRHGRKVAVVVSPEAWERRMRRKGTIVEFFSQSPLRGSKLDLRRIKDSPRPVNL